MYFNSKYSTVYVTVLVSLQRIGYLLLPVNIHDMTYTLCKHIISFYSKHDAHLSAGLLLDLTTKQEICQSVCVSFTYLENSSSDVLQMWQVEPA